MVGTAAAMIIFNDKRVDGRSNTWRPIVKNKLIVKFAVQLAVCIVFVSHVKVLHTNIA